MMRIGRACSKTGRGGDPRCCNVPSRSRTHLLRFRNTLGARERLNARRRFRAFVVRATLLLRRLGEFIAAGGPLS